ncbi:hypothetical protein KEJ17_06690 [Candidatus Bathyarchaeota archaeon]|nr:hypothetical protein [Candidatus Bathyarchaeota archaeon]
MGILDLLFMLAQAKYHVTPPPDELIDSLARGNVESPMSFKDMFPATGGRIANPFILAQHISGTTLSYIKMLKVGDKYRV